MRTENLQSKGLEEEKREYNERKQRKGYMAQIHADNTRWLLSIWIDLFNLIPSGQAIDANSSKQAIIMEPYSFQRILAEFYNSSALEQKPETK